MTFYVHGEFAEDNLAIFWLYFLGSPQEVKNYTYTFSITTKIGEKFTYYGHVKPLDEKRNDIIAQRSVFVLSTEVIKKALDEKNKFQLEITIHALMEEDKSRDMEIPNCIICFRLKLPCAALNCGHTFCRLCINR